MMVSIADLKDMRIQVRKLKKISEEHEQRIKKLEEEGY